MDSPFSQCRGCGFGCLGSIGWAMVDNDIWFGLCCIFGIGCGGYLGWAVLANWDGLWWILGVRCGRYLCCGGY